jgi:hypothetical protein
VVTREMSREKKFLAIIFSSALLFTGCSNSAVSRPADLPAESANTGGFQQIIEIQFCEDVLKGYASYQKEGMSYATRDIFERAYYTIEELYDYGSRYKDYFIEMDWLSRSWQNEQFNQSSLAALPEIVSWCKSKT